MPPMVTIEVDTKAKYRRVWQAEATGQPEQERLCEHKHSSGHILQCLGDTIECMKCNALWKNEGY